MVVGISDYAHAGLAAMSAAATGAAHTARLLRDPAIWGVPHEHVTVLGSESTQEQILTAARDAALATEDTLVVYFAGHGLRDQAERLHLALVDADPDYPQIGTLPYRLLRDLIRQAGHRARHRVTILDCCYSGIAGGMSPGAPTRDDLAAALDEDPEAQATGAHSGEGESRGWDESGYGDCVLTSAPPHSRSFVRPGAAFPEFTGELIATLEAGICGVGPEISLEHIWLRVRDRMRGRDSPEPQLFAQNNVTRHIHLLNRSPRERREREAAPDPDPGPSAAHIAARDAAENAARTVPDRFTRMGLLARIASATIAVDPGKARLLADEVVEAGHDTTDLSQRARLLTSAATCLVALDPPRARSLAEEGEEAVLGMADPDARASGLIDLASAVVDADRDRATWLLERAEEALHGLPDTRHKAARFRTLSVLVNEDEPAWRQRLKDHSAHLYRVVDERERFEEDSRCSPEGVRRAREVRSNTGPEWGWRVVELATIAKDVALERHYHQAVELLEEAEKAVPGIVLDEKAEALSALTKALPFLTPAAATIPDRVVDLVGRLRSVVWGCADEALGDRLIGVARTQADVAYELADKDPRRAVGLLRVAQAVKPELNVQQQRRLDRYLARDLARVGEGLAPLDAEQAAALAHESIAIVRALEDDLTRELGLALSVLALAGQHLAVADPDRADELLAEAEALAHQLPEKRRAFVLKDVASALTTAGRDAAGTDPARLDRYVRMFDRLLLSLPEKDRNFPRTAMASTLVVAGKSVVDRDTGRALGYAREAERLACQVPAEDEMRDHGLFYVASLQAEVVKHRPAHADRAIRTAESITDDGLKSVTVRNVAIALAPADTEHAERIAQNVTDAGDRAGALAAIAEARR
ncbi:caspase, EACC1-associated type [Streptomyces diacarni]|uniref:caspase, EACC1-associated type n=1 Tax=Streptomyces diacarni TaxID=2800381 RepID=UPI0015EFE4C4|nr:caspase family protein [Streptomyces diacarni]